MKALRVLARSGHAIVGVFTTREADTAVYRFATEQGYRVWPAEFVRDERAVEALQGCNVDLLLNVHSLYIIHRSLIETPRIGAFNLHPSALPRLAGLNSISWAIYRGEKMHGVTLHHLTPGIDRGAIAYQRTFPLNDTDTPVALMARCAEHGAEIIRELLDTAARDPNQIPATPQNFTERDYHGPETPNDAWVDWRESSEAILRFVRACDYHPYRSPWGHPRSMVGSREVHIVKAQAVREPCTAMPGALDLGPDGSVRAAAGDAWIALSRVRIDGRRAAPTELLDLGRRFSLPQASPASADLSAGLGG